MASPGTDPSVRLKLWAVHSDAEFAPIRAHPDAMHTAFSADGLPARPVASLLLTVGLIYFDAAVSASTIPPLMMPFRVSVSWTARSRQSIHRLKRNFLLLRSRCQPP
jgi:hypothetical protein